MNGMAYGSDGDQNVLPAIGKFVVEGACQGSVRRVFLRWGWQEVKDPMSADCDVKWVCAKRFLEGSAVSSSPTQLVNHFWGSHFIDNKALMGQCIDCCAACTNLFFPRQYDLQNPDNFANFLQDYMETQASALQHLFDEPAAGHSVDAETVSVARHVLQRRSSPLLCCAHECERILGQGCQISAKQKLMMRSFVETFLAQASSPPAECSICMQHDQGNQSSAPTQSDSSAILRCQKQPPMMGSANAWVVKDPGMSLGRGVSVHKGLPSLLAEVDRCRNSCVVQKYLEQPLLVQTSDNGFAKADLRLWVFVLDWNPLIVFANPGVYFRVATRHYGFGKDGQANEFAHKTNCRDEDNRESLNTFLSRFGSEAAGNWEKHTWPLMMDAVRAVLYACRDCVLGCELEAVKKPRPSAFELFGFDFALDASWHPWLLEGNVYADMLEKLTCQEAPELMAWAEGAIDSFLKLAIRYRKQQLVLPKPSELQALSAQEAADGVSRMFTSEHLENSDHSSTRCYGKLVAQVPDCLVSGLELTPPYGSWRLILRDEATPVATIQAAYQDHQKRCGWIAASRGAGQLTHARILRQYLLPAQRDDVKPKGERPSKKPQRAPACPSIVRRVRSVGSM